GVGGGGPAVCAATVVVPGDGGAGGRGGDGRHPGREGSRGGSAEAIADADVLGVGAATELLGAADAAADGTTGGGGAVTTVADGGVCTAAGGWALPIKAKYATAAAATRPAPTSHGVVDPRRGGSVSTR